MILTLDIGGTKTLTSLFGDGDSFAQPIWSETISTFYKYNDLLNYLNTLQTKFENTNLKSVGVSFGVSFSSDGRRILAAGKMEDFEGKNIAQDFENIFECRCIFAHDCICALIAEQKNSSIDFNAAYVTVSSGVGGAVMLINGTDRLFVRTRLAHQIIQSNGEPCKCGQTGCLAAYLDGKEIEKKINSKLEEVADYTFWSAFTNHLAIGLVNLSWMFPVQKIIVGGGIVLNNYFVNKYLQNEFNQVRSKGNQYECKIEYPSLGEYAPSYGAAYLATNQNLNIIYT